MQLAKVNAHYQVTIPKAIRSRARISKGAYVKVGYQRGTILIRPVSIIEEKDEAVGRRQAAERKFAEVWKDEKDALWESYL